MTAQRMTWQHWVRLSVFLIFTAFMTFGPFYSQLIHSNGASRILFRSWTMFSAFGLGTVDVRFTHVRDDGTEVVLDRYETLKDAYEKSKRGPRHRWFYSNWSKWKSIPLQFWSIRPGEEALHAKRLCEVLGTGSIRIDSRIATRHGWVPAVKDEVIRCDGESATE